MKLYQVGFHRTPDTVLIWAHDQESVGAVAEDWWLLHRQSSNEETHIPDLIICELIPTPEPRVALYYKAY